MADVGERVSSMQPERGDTTISLPITFDFSGGREESRKMRKWWSIGISALGLIFALGFLFSGRWFFPFRVLASFGIIIATYKIITLFLLNESKIRKQQEFIDKNDMQMSLKDIWGIYEIESDFPYYCRFRNNLSGIFIMLNKDVIIGKYEDMEYNHYESIADAYNIAGSSRISMTHIDFMDVVGSDERLNNSLIRASQIKNPDLQDLMTDILVYLQGELQQNVTTFDCYLFTWRGSDVQAWTAVEGILNCFLEANYYSYYPMNEDDLQEMAKVLYNIHDFSVNDACVNALQTESRRSIVPISIKSEGVLTKLNKTVEEKQEEIKQKKLEEDARKEELKRRKKDKSKRKKKNKEDVEELDIF